MSVNSSQNGTRTNAPCAGIQKPCNIDSWPGRRVLSWPASCFVARHARRLPFNTNEPRVVLEFHFRREIDLEAELAPTLQPQYATWTTPPVPSSPLLLSSSPVVVLDGPHIPNVATFFARSPPDPPHRPPCLCSHPPCHKVQGAKAPARSIPRHTYAYIPRHQPPNSGELHGSISRIRNPYRITAVRLWQAEGPRR